MNQQNNKLAIAGLTLLLTVLVVFILIMASVPPVSRDALTHHLAVPKLWLERGGMHEMADIEFSYYPMNLDLLYTVALYFGSDIAPKYIHFAFALATAWLIFSYLSARLDRVFALVGALLFLTTPVIVKLSVSVYVDLGLVFFSTLSLLALFSWADSGFRTFWLATAGIACGLALGTKYNGLISFFLLTLIVVYLYLRQNRGLAAGTQVKALLHGLVFAAVALFVFLPWMAKNYVWTGNPLYPLYDRHFQTAAASGGQNPQASDNGSGIAGEDAGAISGKTKIDSHFLVRKLVYGETWWQTAAIPLRIFFEGQDDNPKYFDGKLNPFLMLLPLILLGGTRFYPARFRLEMRVLALFALVYLLLVHLRVDMRIRWVTPIIPALVMLSATALHRVHALCRRCSAAGTVAVCKVGLWGAVAAMLALNAVYMTDLYQKIDPLDYLAGRVSRDAYIQKYRPEYDAIRYANAHTPGDAVILGVFLGNRRYYSTRPMRFSYNVLKKTIQQTNSARQTAALLKAQGITHLIINHGLFNQWVHDGFTPSEKNVMVDFLSEYCETLFSKDGHSLVKLL